MKNNRSDMIVKALRECRHRDEGGAMRIISRQLCYEAAKEIEKLHRILAELLMSSDCTWEKGGGHDYGVACEEARKSLGG